MTTNYILLAVLIILQLGDWYTTHTIISKGGKELNPVMVWAIGKVGQTAAFAIKGLLVIAIGVLAAQISALEIGALAGVYALIVGWNFYQTKV